MKNRFLIIAVVVVALCGSAVAQIDDNTQAGVDAQTQILKARQADVRRAREVLLSTFNFPSSVAGVSLTLPDLGDGLYGDYDSQGRVVRINNRDMVLGFAGLTVFHECGHWFDNRVIAPALLGSIAPGDADVTFASEHHELNEMLAWQRAVHASQTYRALYALAQKKQYSAKTAEGQYIRYVMSDTEMFARSFCQYVALQSGDATYHAQMNKVVDDQWPFCGQWRDNDFSPIRAALDALFKKHNWLKLQ